MGRGSKKSSQRKEGRRTPSGRLSRSKSAKRASRDRAERQAFEDGPQQTVLQARRRQLRGVKCMEADRAPVSKDQAHKLRLRDRGSVLGIWMADGKLTRDQVRAGEDYCQRYGRYAQLCGLPKPTAKISSYSDARGGGSRPDRIEAARRAKAEHDHDRNILRHCSPHNVLWAMKRACVLDEVAPLDLVRAGLDALLAHNR